MSHPVLDREQPETNEFNKFRLLYVIRINFIVRINFRYFCSNFVRADLLIELIFLG